MQIRRCAVLYLEPREVLEVDWRSLFSGGGALSASVNWVALAPHLDREVPLTADDLPALGGIGQTNWRACAELEAQYGAAAVARLLECGLLVSDDPAHAHWRGRDDVLRAQHWRPLAATAHIFSRWQGMSSESGMQFPTFEDLVQVYGEPPALSVRRTPAGQAVALPPPEAGPMDGVLMRRYTGRNFDTGAALPLAQAARLLQRTFGAQGRREMAPDTYVLKKTSPSAGGLHPMEAYVLVQRVEGLAPGLYHYQAEDHALEPVRGLTSDAAHRLAMVAVADQEWFADAPFMAILAARVVRNFWKYRNHVKAHRAVMLDAGHLSQTMYLLAVEAGLAGFVTAAINEVDLEQALGLDPLCDAVLAVCGCGPAGPGAHVELRI